MKAIFTTGGKQYYVAEGDVIYVEKLNNEVGSDVVFNVGDVIFIEKLDSEDGSSVVFDKVLMANGIIGNPYVKGAKVVCTVEKTGRQKKVIVFKYRPKKSSHKKQGHRQPYTKLVVKKIEAK